MCRQGPSELVYDFCYLPIDFKNRCNLGYAFVNFVDARSTLECYRAFHEKRWNDFNSKKVPLLCLALGPPTTGYQGNQKDWQILREKFSSLLLSSCIWLQPI